MDPGAKPAMEEGTAALHVPCKPTMHGGSSALDLETRLAVALAQQSAIAEILEVIGASPADVQPVLDVVTARAAQLCDAPAGRMLLAEGELLRPVAHWAAGDWDPGRARPVPLKRTSIIGRAALDRTTIHHPDVVPLLDAEYPAAKENILTGGIRAILAVPLVHAGGAYGGIALYRPEPRPFTPSQIALVQTFARQAAIAIHGVRLFHDTREALEQQTATSEVLRAISRSPAAIEPVLEAVVGAAARFCDAPDVLILRLDGDVLRGAAAVGPFADVLVSRAGSLRNVEIPLSRESVSGRAALECRSVHVHDLAAELDEEYPVGRMLQQRFGHRTIVATPLVSGTQVIGAIVMFRTEVRPFSARQVELLETFAAQAVIAIENTRLFAELQARTRELTRSVEELTALGEVGRAVSSTLDLETVLSTIVSRATRLAGVEGGAIYEYDESAERFHLHTTEHLPEELVEALQTNPVRKGEGALGRLAVTREPVQVPDIADEAHYRSRLRDMLIRNGYRSLLAVPLLREDHLLGGLVVNRNQPGEFAPEVIGLLKTFATQSALAIQNARLFREIEHKGRQLEAASRHKSEFLANMSHELRTPLNAIIGFSEVLAERMFGDINDRQAEYLADILDSGRHLLSLINDILDLSKIEAGRMELEPAEFDLAGAIENALILVKERAHRQGIALASHVDQAIGKILGDERKVKQVLLNLLSNALKFTPEGGRVDVRAVVNGEAIEVSIADTGSGIAPDDLETVFEEFRQVGRSAAKVEGTGLGLAISRKFVELHGGRIGLTSRVGVGSTFTFTLPRWQR